MVRSATAAARGLAMAAAVVCACHARDDRSRVTGAVIPPGREGVIVGFVGAAATHAGVDRTSLSISVRQRWIEVTSPGLAGVTLVLGPPDGPSPGGISVARNVSLRCATRCAPTTTARLRPLAEALADGRDDAAPRIWTRVDEGPGAAVTTAESGERHAAARESRRAPGRAPLRPGEHATWIDDLPWSALWWSLLALAAWAQTLIAARLTDRARRIAGVVTAALSGLAVALVVSRVAPGRVFTAEHDIFHLRAWQCLDGGGCPRSSAFLQGPGYVLLLALLHLVTPTPVEFWLSLACLGVAAALTARGLDARLGAPWGALASLWIACNLTVLTAFRDGLHAPFVVLPLALCVGATVRWAEGAGGRWLALATCMAGVAMNFHGVSLLALAGVALVGVALRPPTGARWALTATAAPVLLNATALVERLGDRGPSSSASAAVIYQALRGAGPPDADVTLGATDAGVVAGALVLLLASVGPRSMRASSTAARALLLQLVAALGVYGATHLHAQWRGRYMMVFVPLVPAALAAAFGVVDAWLREASSRGRPRLAMAARAVMFAAAAFSCATSVGDLRRAMPRIVDHGENLTFDEQVAALRLAASRGVGRDEVLRRVHGASWWWSEVGPRALARAVNAPTVGRGAEHLLVVDECLAVSSEFARAQRRTEGPHGHALAVYAPRLATGDAVLRRDGGEATLGAVDTRFLRGEPYGAAASPLRQRLDLALRDRSVRALELRYRVSPGATRALVVQHLAATRVDVTLDGAPVTSLPPRASRRSPRPVVVDRYALTPTDGAATLVISIPRASLDAPFVELDVGEEPVEACVRPR